ncbi:MULTISPECIES: branched-chain amino acid ABC transporter permease [unclassified Nocardioides]|uniref:branched-chain amino acid ABC transporter permease n=1 Tax=unclassified Nocardioides TaxID=2615069 RepID=UPI00361F1F7E
MTMPNRGVDEGVDVLRMARRRSAVRSTGVVVVLLAAFSVWAVTTHGASLYLQRLIDGVTNGTQYGLAALALVLVFKATKVINFSQGAMALMGTYLAYTFVESWGMPLALGIVLAMIVSAAGAGALQRTLIRPFDPNNHLAITIVTLALFLILNALVALIWGFQPKGFPTLFPKGADAYIAIGGARLYYSALGTFLLAVAVVVLLQLLMSKTRLGLRFRSMASSVDSAKLVGVNINRTIQGAWAAAAAVGTLAGCLIAPGTVLDPLMMDKVLIYSFAAATLGGLDSITGALVGGIVVGLTITFLTGYVPAFGGQFGLGCAFLVIIAVLQFRPAGLFGARSMERV